MSEDQGGGRHGAGKGRALNGAPTAPGAEEDGVVVEWPCDGIAQTTASDDPSSSFVADTADFEAASSLSSPSLIEGLGDLELASNSSAVGSSFAKVPINADDWSHSDSVSSWSLVASEGRPPRPPGSVADAESDSFATVAAAGASASVCDEGSSVKPHFDHDWFDIGGQGEDPSFSPYFEVVWDEAIQEYARRCKRCTFHNPMWIISCNCCEYGPIVSDEEIALSLQQEEEYGDVSEAHRLRIDAMSMPERVACFSEDVNSFLSELSAGVLKTLDHDCLVRLALPFSRALESNNGSDVKISLLYTATPNNISSWDSVRDGGFHRAVTSPQFTNNLDAALRMATGSKSMRGSRVRSSQRDYLHSIPEEWGSLSESEEQITYSACRCWLAATLHFSGDDTTVDTVRAKSGYATVWMLGRPELAIPLVSFPARLRDDDIVRRLHNGLSRILRYSFGSYEMGVHNNGAADRSASRRQAELDKDKEPWTRRSKGRSLTALKSRE